jgi:DNA-binding transcriptional MerR regulator
MVRSDASYSLEELSAEVAHLLGERGLLGAAPDARVSDAPDARTVRYYSTLGLLDRPRIENRQARYGKRHILQLLAIKALQAHDLPLAEIQQRLYARSDAELSTLVKSLHVEKTETELPSLMLREVVLEPGLRLVVEEGWKPRDPAALEQKLRAAVAALQRNGGSK